MYIGQNSGLNIEFDYVFFKTVPKQMISPQLALARQRSAVSERFKKRMLYLKKVFLEGGAIIRELAVGPEVDDFERKNLVVKKIYYTKVLTDTLI